MALFGDDQGRTEKPTPGRLGEVRNRGDTSLSREFVQGGTLLIAAVMLLWLGEWLLDSLGEIMRRGLDVSLRGRDVAQVGGAYREMLGALWQVVLPFGLLLATLLAAVMVLGYGQIGMQVSREVLGFKLERLNPVANWKRVFSFAAIVRTGFAALKLLVILGVLWLVVGNRWQALLHLHELPFGRAVAEIGELALLLLLWVGGVVFALAVGDLFWQRFDFEKRNMMTKQEVDDERRRAEGDPVMKGRQRRARAELMRHRMMEAVPKADVVITNPTHVSVALRYERARNQAPVVVAKGVDEVALRIREIAREHDVPMMEDPPLARALMRAVKVGQEVPAKFYQAVATVLSHVYRLKGMVA